jgi:hypothetical protein
MSDWMTDASFSLVLSSRVFISDSSESTLATSSRLAAVAVAVPAREDCRARPSVSTSAATAATWAALAEDVPAVFTTCDCMGIVLNFNE